MLKITPFNTHILTNPVYQLDARRLKYGATPITLKRWSFRIFLRVCIIITIVMILFGYLNWSSQQAYYNTLTAQSITTYTIPIESFIASWILGWAQLIFVISIGSAFILDLTILSQSLNAINTDVAQGRWDLLRLTTLSPSTVIAAKHTLTRLRSWQSLMTVLSLRLIAVGLSLLLILFASIAYGPSFFEEVIIPLYRSFIERPIAMSFLAAMTVCFVFVYLFEVIWRHRALSALLLWLSARHSTANAILIGLAAIAGVWISQAAIMGLIFTVAGQVSNLVSGLFSQNWRLQSDLLNIGFACLCFLIGTTIFLYYRLLYHHSLRRAQDRAFNDMEKL
ncbi:MAG: hypothetical protein MUF87_03295 [Anaerolineae bacterium]|jgi:hypothetical protein|nr:hypothetical protein [Anaerolineae bacterium]